VCGNHLIPDIASAARRRAQSGITSCSVSKVALACSCFVRLSIKSAHFVRSGRFGDQGMRHTLSERLAFRQRILPVHDSRLMAALGRLAK
jgi:hypothetical protein